MDIILTIIYATLIGVYNLFKKLAVGKSNESVILVLYTSLAFLLSLLWIPFGLSISTNFVLIFMLKGFLLATSWFLVLKVLKTADISLVMITSVISAVLSFILGIVVFKESTSALQIIGSIIIIVGVAIINLLDKSHEKKKTSLIHFIFLLISALIVTSSNVIDKYTTTHLSAFQTQFWFLLFVCLFSWGYFIIECIKQKQFLITKSDFKNGWIYPIGIILFVADFILFMAYKVPGSKMITISILSKLKIVVPVIAGVFVFKEKNIAKKFALTFLVIFGAVLIAL